MHSNSRSNAQLSEAWTANACKQSVMGLHVQRKLEHVVNNTLHLSSLAHNQDLLCMLPWSFAHAPLQNIVTDLTFACRQSPHCATLQRLIQTAD